MDKQLTEKELQSLRQVMTQKNEILLKLGSLSVQLENINKEQKNELRQLEKVELDCQNILEDLKQIYGDGVVDLSTGEIKKEFE